MVFSCCCILYSFIVPLFRALVFSSENISRLKIFHIFHSVFFKSRLCSKGFTSYRMLYGDLSLVIFCVNGLWRKVVALAKSPHVLNFLNNYLLFLLSVLFSDCHFVLLLLFKNYNLPFFILFCDL